MSGIDAKSFIEFLEKEYGAICVDAATGERTLDVIARNQKCGTCKWLVHGDGEWSSTEDTFCANGRSEHLADYVHCDAGCDFWERGQR